VPAAAAGEKTTPMSEASPSPRARRRGSAAPAAAPSCAEGAPPLAPPSGAAGPAPPDTSSGDAARGAPVARPESASRAAARPREREGPGAPLRRRRCAAGGADSESSPPALPAGRFCLLLMASPLLTPLLTASALRRHAACGASVCGCVSRAAETCAAAARCAPAWPAWTWRRARHGPAAARRGCGCGRACVSFCAQSA
jgi:hypothetical protein